MTDPATTQTSPDSDTRKGFWRAVRAGLRWIAHVALTPLRAATAGLAAFFNTLHEDISKV